MLWGTDRSTASGGHTVASRWLCVGPFVCLIFVWLDHNPPTHVCVFLSLAGGGLHAQEDAQEINAIFKFERKRVLFKSVYIYVFGNFLYGHHCGRRDISQSGATTRRCAHP